MADKKVRARKVAVSGQASENGSSYLTWRRHPLVQHRWALPQPLPIRLQSAKGFAAGLVALYVYFLSSRSFEILTQITGRDLYIMLLLSAVGLSIVLAKGTFARAAQTPAGLILLVFTGWAMLILPFSSWKGESLHELTNVWLKSVAAYLIIVGLTTNLAIAKKVYLGVALGGISSALLIYKFGWYDGGRLTGFGSLANSNEVAFHLVVSLPFVFLLMSRVKVIWKVALGAVVLLALQLSLKTASRSGLIMLGVIFAVSFLRVSFGNKTKMIAVGAIAPHCRIRFHQPGPDGPLLHAIFLDDTSAAAQSARLSGQERRHKFDEAIELTFMNPIFGVGMGAFIPSSVALAESKGEKGVWIMPHNSYAQVSSEMGFIGVILFVAVLVVCFRALLKVDKRAKRLNLQDIRGMALCMLLALCVMCIHFTFDAIAYQFYLPMMAGLATALTMNAEPILRAAEARAEGRELPEGTALLEAELVGPELAPVGERSHERMLSGRIETGRPPIERKHNPYRFGRRRNH